MELGYDFAAENLTEGHSAMTDTDQEMLLHVPDNGDRRSGIERRQFQYTSHIPERRSGHDRRSGLDRRSGFDRRSMEPGKSVDRRNAFPPSFDPAGE
jgi:hypothetical protein